MAVTNSSSPEPEPEHPSSRDSVRKPGNGDRSERKTLPPAATTIWRRKWIPLSGRVTPRQPGVLCWRRTFAGIPQQVSAARRFTHSLLADTSAADDAAWVTGELATNAIKYSRSGSEGGVFTVEVLRWRHRVQIQVTDAGGDNEPILPTTAPSALFTERRLLREGRRGLYGIGALAHEFGTYQHTDGSRVIWVRLKTDPAAVIGADQ
ncbi:ATP-binding protein [Actinoallomurus rhizosphaericola]|uniref:ATP-binding protein n=1 Tax=Actinoallomurus rhizosphaericola TaxID=2952536 RepID=UPI0020938933|nr:ATP-binding protein [Actinoallomurus rhizosphaericola]MCO5999807.1 ATP-binding protein [Actinoallomurus rhizosphaericola]